MSSQDSTELDESISGVDDTWLQKTAVGKFLGKPCVGGSFALGAAGYFATFLGSFGWTSNFPKATRHAGITCIVVTFTSSAVCTFNKIIREAEKKTKNAEQEEERARRQEAILKKIEERKRKHAERKKLEEQAGLVIADGSGTS